MTSTRALRCSRSVSPPARPKGYDNPQIVLLETQSGARIDVEVQVADAYGYDIQCQVVCERRAQSTCPIPMPLSSARMQAVPSPSSPTGRTRFIEAYDIELTHWVKTLEEKGEPDGYPSAWDGYAACVAADALNRSRGTADSCRSRPWRSRSCTDKPVSR